jgi:putative transposase
MLFPVSNFGIGKGPTGGIKLLPSLLKATSKKNRQLQIYGVSGTVLIKLHRELEGRPKNVSLKRQGDKWFVVVCCEDVPKPAQTTSTKQIGLDLGVNVFAVDSDGISHPSPKSWKTAKEKIAYLSRQLARKQKGSNNRKKAKSALAKAHEHVANVREDHQHKLSAKLVKESKLIAIEDLSIRRMLSIKEGKHQQTLHSSISDSAWFAFRQKLEYKAERAGVQVVAVDPRNTSKTCSSCLQVKKKLALSERTFYCSACGSTMDRDANAARNILRLGLSLVGAQSAPCAKAKKAASLPSKLKRKAEEQ